MADTSTIEFDCKEKSANFCYVCAKYVSDKLKSKFTKLSQDRYMKLFQAPNLKNFGYSFTGKVVCGSCKGRLSNRTKHEGKFNVPAIWHAPKTLDHDDCYLCQTELTEEEKKEPRKFEYDGSLSVELPQIVKKLPNASVFDDSDFSDEEEERSSPADQTNADESRMIDESRYEDESRIVDESKIVDESRIGDESGYEDELKTSEDSKEPDEDSKEQGEDPKASDEEPDGDTKEQDDDSKEFDDDSKVSDDDSNVLEEFSKAPGDDDLNTSDESSESGESSSSEESDDEF